MIGSLQGVIDRFFGRGAAAVTVPPLDGALKPNTLLEDAPEGIFGSEPDNLVALDGQPVWSEAGAVLQGVSKKTLVELDSPVTALAVSKDGTLAIATLDNGLWLRERNGSLTAPDWGAKLTCVTAMDFTQNGQLLICIGSTRNSYDQWSRDLLEQNGSGLLLRVDPASGQVETRARKLGWPNGVLADGDDAVVCIAWGKHVVRFNGSGKGRRDLIEDLPGYPARISPNGRGGYWLALFAPRSQLIEFVLREPVYRRAMMAEVAPDLWIAPVLRSGTSFQEPMQGGALKQMGVLKPWAPTRSYGLVIELSDSFVPLRSFHSRAGGRRHGVTSVLELDGTVWATSKGGDELVPLLTPSTSRIAEGLQ